MQVALNIPEQSLRWWNSCAVTWASSHPSARSSASPELGWEAGDVSCLLATDPSGGSWPSHTSRPACLTPGRSLLPASAPSALNLWPRTCGPDAPAEPGFFCAQQSLLFPASWPLQMLFLLPRLAPLNFWPQPLLPDFKIIGDPKELLIMRTLSIDSYCIRN